MFSKSCKEALIQKRITKEEKVNIRYVTYSQRQTLQLYNVNTFDEVQDCIFKVLKTMLNLASVPATVWWGAMAKKSMLETHGSRRSIRCGELSISCKDLFWQSFSIRGLDHKTSHSTLQEHRKWRVPLLCYQKYSYS